ncbi:hypothetical protein ACFWOT_20595 [Streptomyces sp. NPDC058440]|uniref:hypothetical protein n=1 Tax=Streptomyces sp. NPDC058440 TaxID=3346501 RepID=UPI00364AAE14
MNAAAGGRPMFAADQLPGDVCAYLRFKLLLSDGPGTMRGMQPLPTPCPADLIPDATGQDAFSAACHAAKQQRVVLVAIERQGERWAVKADALTAPQHGVSTTVYEAIQAAVIRLIRAHEIRADSSAGPVYFVLYDVETESRARELAAALHAALYGNLDPLNRAVPATPA